MNPVIKPSLVVGLVGALAASALLSGVLIVKLGRFDDAKQQADEAESRTAKHTTKLAELKTEIESLTRQKDTLQPQIADWQERLKDKAAAEAALVALEAKQRQAETGHTRANKRFEEANRIMLDAEKQKSDLAANVERRKAEVVSLTKTDTKALSRMAAEAEQRHGQC